MGILKVYQELESIAKEFSDVVLDTRILKLPSGEPLKLRVRIVDGSFLDVWISISGKYSYHWERRHIDGTIYRHDNAPHKAWARIKTFPRHFHDGVDENVVESELNSIPQKAIRAVLRFVRAVVSANREYEAGVPSKTHKILLVQIQPGERLATTSELNLASGLVTDCGKARGMGY